MKFFSKLHESQQLSGIVEADETYLLHSKKGDKNLNREPRERGGESDYHGLSRDQDCILTLKDRSGSIFVKLVGQARPAFDDIEQPIAQRMSSDAVLCTDGMKAYGKFSREYGVERKNIKETDERSYHIQGINALHHEIKDWLREFRGIASKYIDTYLGYFAYQRAMTG